ncbi:hypothetical protein WR164_03830 [Philodulcilactobacillus myokoensis]|uniref:Methyltransferase domain-containing protein n=1 Tax=Philodulcilactobacillus myokoensis TaxID=2929573 RepID=A0A9W6ESR2_9LACO|nr:class I SAM-dependent methyltransferase [Philodulcilactobacillus myokoensis]GLB46404.1 hypothetical protein WR164_03830 [Philodulcilactobacillus myokoensis]
MQRILKYYLVNFIQLILILIVLLGLLIGSLMIPDSNVKIIAIAVILLMLILIARSTSSYWIESAMIKSIFKYLHLHKSFVVLDLSSGNGYLLNQLANQPSSKIVGIETHHQERMLKRARQNVKFKRNSYKTSIMNGNPYDLPFDNQTFNLITMCDTRKSIFRYSQNYNLMMNELLRVLKKNGKILVIARKRPLVKIANILDGRNARVMMYDYHFQFLFSLRAMVVSTSTKRFKK